MTEQHRSNGAVSRVASFSCAYGGLFGIPWAGAISKKSSQNVGCLSMILRCIALVRHYAPELDKRCRLHLKACNDSWKVDETSSKIKKVWIYLYRAVDSKGNTLEFLLSSTCDAEAAKLCFLKALNSTFDLAPQTHRMKGQMAHPPAAGNPTMPTPRVINVAKNAAHPNQTIHTKQSSPRIPDRVVTLS